MGEAKKRNVSGGGQLIQKGEADLAQSKEKTEREGRREGGKKEEKGREAWSRWELARGGL